MRLTQYLTEAFDKPYNFKLHRTGEVNRGTYKISANVTTENGDKLSLRLNQQYHGGKIVAEIDFTLNGKYSMTNKGDAFRILATALEFSRQCIEQIKKDGVAFETIVMSAEKEEYDTSTPRPELKDTGRVSLYTRMMKRYLPKDWKVEVKDWDDQVKFFLSPKK